MGTKTAPTYANIFIKKLDTEMLSNCPNHLRELTFDRTRSINDNLLGTFEELEKLYSYLNNYHKV
jgi:hypothetical protein